MTKSTATAAVAEKTITNHEQTTTQALTLSELSIDDRFNRLIRTPTPVSIPAAVCIIPVFIHVFM